MLKLNHFDRYLTCGRQTQGIAHTTLVYGVLQIIRILVVYSGSSS